MLREDIRGICHRPCIYNDKGKCDMWAGDCIEHNYWLPQDRHGAYGFQLPKGSIKKLIGRELSWNDEPVELKGE